MYTRWIPSFGQFLTFRLTDLDEDTEVVHRWMNDPRVSMFWGEEAEDPEKTRSFLKKGLGSKHFFPIIGCWDDEPFGYFEVYWVKEDALGRYASDVDMWDRGVHCLVGEQKFRGPHRVGVWISGLVHFMFLDDPRTQTVMLEPRVDNTKFIKYLVDAGFYKEKEFAFPHKQAALMKLKREAWEGPLC
jgi:RimJ/RimL family protein N-acetyltransferase